MINYTPYKRVYSLKNFTTLDDIFYKGKCTCIYAIWNTTNNKVYIGQTINYKDRYHAHKLDMKRGTHKNRQMLSSFKRGDNLEMFIIENCSREELDGREVFWIAFFKSNNTSNGYNITEGGTDRIKVTRAGILKRSASRRGISIDNSYHNVSIIAYSILTGDFVGEYESLKSAGISLSVNKNDISSCCRGNHNRVGMYTFRYKNIGYPLHIDIPNNIGYCIIDKIDIKDNKIIDSILGKSTLAGIIGLSKPYTYLLLSRDGYIIRNGYKYTERK